MKNRKGTRGRHPHQVMDVDDLVVGDSYEMLYLDQAGDILAEKLLTMAGVVSGSPPPPSPKPPFTKPFIPPPLTELLAPPPAPPGRDSFVTVHPDGWPYTFMSSSAGPVLVYWDGDRYFGWDSIETFFSDEGGAQIVVPRRAWLDDPRVDDGPPGVYAASAPDFEAETRRRRDEAMRRRHGF